MFNSRFKSDCKTIHGKTNVTREEMKRGVNGSSQKPGGVTFALAALLVPLEAGFAPADAVDVCLVANGVLSARIAFLST